MIKITQLTKSFFPGTVNERVALRDLSFTLAEGDFATVIGSNGAGKSTLLNIISGRMRPDAGSITIGSRDVTRMSEHRRAGFVSRVFQDPMAGTSPHLTIEENLAVALERGRRRGLGQAVTRRRRALFAEELSRLELGLENRLTLKVGLLSGGQRQALSLLMATFVQPEVLLLDEHTAALDPERAALILRLTDEGVARHQLTTLMVTHNMSQALAHGNRLLMMHDGQIVLDLAAEQKATRTPEDLMAEFSSHRGELADRMLLGD
ncbi:ABC transporter ATP-binding protein [Tessaracoccus sp. SD287]|uniref:ABC transporter ATP-binding protein n=1 Tax=Tessaracoccus sp. SD287 TaxID=2782008 RepID=UPI001A959FCB|nr:ABC transporter ATP-binding protein [Tessaracoccus sp. SD287]MBO1031467.1 ABC transporter ATP-binding protein [Tessaracoccus sp. SD287]